jgi:hypothetical protein
MPVVYHSAIVVGGFIKPPYSVDGKVSQVIAELVEIFFGIDFNLFGDPGAAP